MNRAFHPLSVCRVERLTADAVAITFAVPERLAAAFAFAPGQSLTLRHGTDRRSYSICSPLGAAPRIGVREVPGGEVSGWLTTEVRTGDVIDVQAPRGHFTPELGTPAHHLLIAAGSGITPLLSIASSVLAAHHGSQVTLVYGNRRSDTVMFVDDLADLKDMYPARIRIVHVLSREPRDAELFNGRLDAARLRKLLPVMVDVTSVGHWWLCGPIGLLTDAATVLGEHGVAADRIHRELFWLGDDPPRPVTRPETATAAVAEVTVVLDGRATAVRMPEGATVLEATQRSRPDVPFACRGGVCGTCRARVVHGSARMRCNHALDPDEVAAGYVLTCQAEALTDRLTVDYDA